MADERNAETFNTPRQYTSRQHFLNALTVPTEPHTSFPADAPEGTIYRDSNRGTLAWFDRDHYEYPNFVDDVLLDDVTVANTTTRTKVWDPGINSGSLIQGRTYQIDLMGDFSTANTSDQFTVDINLAGATDVADLQNTAANATDAPWSIETTFTVREHGENGSLKPHTRALFASESKGADHGTVAVDTTTATELSVDITWNAADPANSVTLSQAHLKQMG